MKNNKVLLNKDKEKTMYRYIEDKINIKNVTILYIFFELFGSSNASKSPLQFIERNFPMFAESTSFLELDFKRIIKILSSSELHIDSEMEVFDAIVSWLGHNKERKVYAKDLILKIRLSLLSDPALKLIIENVSCFVDDFTIINDVVKDKIKGSQFKIKKNVSRYCTYNNFNLVFCGGKSSDIVVRDVYSVKANDLKTVKSYRNLKKADNGMKLFA